jgi:hypothetical protein
MLNVLELFKPADLTRAVHLRNSVSKLSPFLANICESELMHELNALGGWNGGTWRRQDPAFPDLLLDGVPAPMPGIEIKMWFAMATEITGRFKESFSHFAQDQTDIAVIAWLPEFIVYGKPVILDVWFDSARSIALSRDTHYHNPPDYLIIEPEDTAARTRNLRQTNTSGYKFQGSDALFNKAKRIVDSWGPDGTAFSFSPEYQKKLRELRNTVPYRSDSNFSKLHRIGHVSLNEFRRRVLERPIAGQTIRRWKYIFGRSSRQANQEAIRALIA